MGIRGIRGFVVEIGFGVRRFVFEFGSNIWLNLGKFFKLFFSLFLKWE